MKRKSKNPLTTIHTGTGNKGTTYLKGPGLSKADPLVDFIGTLDEAAAALGRCEVSFSFGSSKECDSQIKMNSLLEQAIEVFFEIGAMVHSTEAKKNHYTDLLVFQAEVEALMKEVIDNEYVDPLEGFIIPDEENGDLMLARAVIRRAEREAVKCGEMDFVPILNVLSDFIFVVVWSTCHYYREWKGFSVPSSANSVEEEGEIKAQRHSLLEAEQDAIKHGLKI